MSIHKDAACWPTVEATCLERIEELHRELESAPIDRVQRMQGELIALRWLLLQAEPDPIPKSTSMD